MSTPGIVIIGAGECGVRAAFSLRENGFDGAIALVGAEASLPYERPPLSKGGDGAIKPIRAREAYSDAAIDLRLGVEVTCIDAAAHRVVLSIGEELHYDKLLIATGARARLFPGMEGCLTLRTDVDAARILAGVRSGARIGIVGGGFIGLELAATARGAGADVTVIEAGPRILGRAVPEQIATVLHSRHEAEGVRLMTGAQVASVTVATITPVGGAPMIFDMVVAGVGSVPNTELAEAAGLAVGNGIRVDRNFGTSDPSIFAAGDCCNFEWRGDCVRLESWKAAQDQGGHAAAAMLGAVETYSKVPWFWSDQYDLTLQVAGLFDMSRPVHERPTGDETRIVFQRDVTGKLAAAAGIGPGNAVAKDIRILEKLIERGAAISADMLADPNTNLKQLLKAV